MEIEAPADIRSLSDIAAITSSSRDQESLSWQCLQIIASALISSLQY
jgi:hypothetical protein